MALIATLALPPYSHELAVMPSEPSAVSKDARASAPPPDPSPQVGAPLAERAVEVSGDVAYGQRTLPEERVVDGPTAATRSPVKLPLEIGDSLKIGFFETVDIGSNKQSVQNGVEPQGALRTFYQRMDLSGDYTVEQDGAISIPLLGRFQVEGQALEDIEAELAASFTSVMGRSANIDVRILDRSPIYVVGPVKNPGAYKYVPRMIVLQAIALAGGLDRAAESLSGMVEGAREMERLRIATLQVEQLLARRARLEAERDGVSALSIPDNGIADQQAKLDRERTAGTFLARESTILRAEQARRRQQDKDIALRVEAARNEVSALKRKLDQFDVEKGLSLERLDTMQKLKDRGVSTTKDVLMLRTELADIEARRQDSLVAVVQAETRLAEAEGDSARRSSENTADIAKEIATVEEKIAAAREATISARVLTTIFYRSSGPALQAETYEIVRQSKNGAKSLEATETSPLMPGDVLKINPNNVAAINPRSVTPTPQSSLAAQ
jgi:exopolysaccharide production protein ExoF